MSRTLRRLTVASIISVALLGVAVVTSDGGGIASEPAVAVLASEPALLPAPGVASTALGVRRADEPRTLVAGQSSEVLWLRGLDPRSHRWPTTVPESPVSDSRFVRWSSRLIPRPAGSEVQHQTASVDPAEVEQMIGAGRGRSGPLLSENNVGSGITNSGVPGENIAEAEAFGPPTSSGDRSSPSEAVDDSPQPPANAVVIDVLPSDGAAEGDTLPLFDTSPVGTGAESTTRSSPGYAAPPVLPGTNTSIDEFGDAPTEPGVGDQSIGSVSTDVSPSDASSLDTVAGAPPVGSAPESGGDGEAEGRSDADVDSPCIDADTAVWGVGHLTSGIVDGDAELGGGYGSDFCRCRVAVGSTDPDAELIVRLDGDPSVDCGALPNPTPGSDGDGGDRGRNEPSAESPCIDGSTGVWGVGHVTSGIVEGDVELGGGYGGDSCWCRTAVGSTDPEASPIVTLHNDASIDCGPLAGPTPESSGADGDESEIDADVAARCIDLASGAWGADYLTSGIVEGDAELGGGYGSDFCR